MTPICSINLSFTFGAKILKIVFLFIDYMCMRSLVSAKTIKTLHWELHLLFEVLRFFYRQKYQTKSCMNLVCSLDLP